MSWWLKAWGKGDPLVPFLFNIMAKICGMTRAIGKGLFHSFEVGKDNILVGLLQYASIKYSNGNNLQTWAQVKKSIHLYTIDTCWKRPIYTRSFEEQTYELMRHHSNSFYTRLFVHSCNVGNTLKNTLYILWEKTKSLDFIFVCKMIKS